MLISSNTTIYFLVKIFFFKCLCCSEYDIRMFLFFFWLRNRPSINYVRNCEMEGGHRKYVQVRTGEKGYHAIFVRTHLHYLFSCFCLTVSCFICRSLTLIWFKKGVFVRHEIFSNETNFCCHETSFFYFKLFFRTKVSKKGFSFNQIES